MKLNFLLLLCAAFLIFSLEEVAADKKKPKPPKRDPKKDGAGKDKRPLKDLKDLDGKKIRGGKHGKAEFGKRGASMKICGDGDCKNRFLFFELSRLVEIDTNGTIVQKARKFNQGNYTWSSPVEAMINGVNATNISLASTLNVGPEELNQTAYFELNATVFHENGTVMNGEQEINVTKGAVKYSISIEDWPWKNDTNLLTFGINLRALLRSRRKMKKTLVKHLKGKKNMIESYEVADGMFCESPENGFGDNNLTNVTTFVTNENDVVVIDYVFPHFKKRIFYDPVLSDSGVENAKDLPSPPSDTEDGEDYSTTETVEGDEIGAEYMPKLKGDKKPAVKIGKKGGMIKLCADGNCAERHIRLQMARLVEIDSNSKIVQKAENFHKSDYQWTNPVHGVNNGVDTTNTSFTATINVGKSQSDPATTFEFNLTIFNSNGTIVDGEESFNVSAGSVKYTILVKNWPWKSSENSLSFGVFLASKMRDDKKLNKDITKKTKGKKNTVARHELAEGVYCDSPATALVDGIETNISTVVTAKNDIVMFDYVFPYFETSLEYDPVLTDSTVNAATDGSGSGGDMNGADSPVQRSFWLVLVSILLALLN